jgi:flavin-dependent dehydrogenase
MELEISELVARQGATVSPATSVIGLGKFDGTGRRVTLLKNREIVNVHAGCVIAADGVSSCVARMAGIDTRLPLINMVSFLGHRIAGAKVQCEDTFYAASLPPPFPRECMFWVIPNGHGELNAGVGLPSLFGGMARPMLAQMMETTDAYSGGSIVADIVGHMSFSPPLEKPFADGIMVAGGAARIVQLATTGIYPGAVSGRMAANTIIKLGNAEATEHALSAFREALSPLYRDIHLVWKQHESSLRDGAKRLAPMMLNGPV